jgi:serine/threonine-protein kinase
VALALKRGMVSRDALRECQRLRAATESKGGRPKSLLHLLVARGHLSREDVATLKRGAGGGGSKGARPPKIPGFEVLGHLGAGGMGTVYKARQVSLDRIVALKVLAPDVAKEASYLQRFMTEARALARLNHENIIAGIDVGEASGYRYFAMEYVDGVSLDRLIEGEGSIPDKRALRIGMQVARALGHAHQHGLVHRDVKPQNIMMASGDVAKLCDLGLAMTGEERKEAQGRGRSLGTPHYISPEQARGEHAVDIRSDIYSLGATLYHAVTGETPFEGGSAMVLMTKHLTEEPVPPHRRRPGVSRAVSELISAMMAKSPAERHQHPIELLEDMERVLHGKSPARGGLGAQGGGPRGRGRAPRETRRAGAAGASGRASGRGRPAPRGGRNPSSQRGLWIALGIVCVLGAVAGVLVYRSYQATLAQQNAPPPAPEVSPEDEARAYDLLTLAMRYRNAEPGDPAGLHRMLLQVIEGFPKSEAASQARGYLQELGLGTAAPEGAPAPGPPPATPAEDPIDETPPDADPDTGEPLGLGGHPSPAA